jgi:hypothetical protein
MFLKRSRACWEYQVSYQPFAFATQVVAAGTNYCFLCTTTLVGPGTTQGAAKVYVSRPLPGQGIPYFTEIHQVFP